MPTTFTGLLLFVVLLLPGFAFVVFKERNTPQVRRSSFRETGEVVAASVVAAIGVLGALALARAIWPAYTPDVGALMRHQTTYMEKHYDLVAVWAVGMLAVGCSCAGLAGHAIGLRAPHPSTTSAWWRLFDEWPKERAIRVTCVLDDGSWVRGTCRSFNQSADETSDRDLVLTEPILYALPGDVEQPYKTSAACISAKHIVSMFVAYIDEGQSEPASLSSALATAVPESASAGPPAPTQGAEERVADPDSGSAHSRQPTATEPQSEPAGVRTSDLDHRAEPSSGPAGPDSSRGYALPCRPPNQVGHAPGPHHRPLGLATPPAQASTDVHLASGGR